MIVGGESLIAANRIVLLGEMHGTRDVPEAVVELARTYDGPLCVGIEWPTSEQAVLDAFMAGAKLDRSSDFWRAPFGVTSEAMIAMLQALRARADTRVFAFVDLENSARTHDELMADNVLARYDADPHAAFIVLAGNMHTRTRRGDAPHFDTLPMGEVLVSQAPVVAFDATYRRGTAWNHLFTVDEKDVTVGIHAIGSGVDHGDAPHVRWFDRPDERGYDGELYLADVEASPPYVT